MALCPGLPGRPVPEETFTHSRPSWSSDIPYQLPPSSTIYTVFLVQFTCLTFLFHNLFPGPVWSSSWSGALYFILHAFLHPIIISFRSTCPYHRSQFCCNTNVMSSIPNLYLSSLLGNLSFSLTPHIHLTILISACRSATTFSFLTAHVSLPCNTLLHTRLTAVQTSSHNQHLVCLSTTTKCGISILPHRQDKRQ